MVGAPVVARLMVAAGHCCAVVSTFPCRRRSSPSSETGRGHRSRRWRGHRCCCCCSSSLLGRLSCCSLLLQGCFGSCVRRRPHRHWGVIRRSTRASGYGQSGGGIGGWAYVQGAATGERLEGQTGVSGVRRSVKRVRACPRCARSVMSVEGRWSEFLIHVRGSAYSAV